MLVKICGLTTPEDAKLADELGANLLGIIFAKSPRRVTVAKAKKIMEAVDHPEKFVAVFVNEKLDTIMDVVSRLGIRWVQLHGDEPDEVGTELAEHGLNVIKVARVKDREDIEKVLDYPADVLLFDTFSHENYGGTGERFDWTLFRSFPRMPKFFLSGGISIDNVQLAHVEVHPAGVDVSSALEAKPGIKDPAKMKAFFEKVDELVNG